MLILTRRVDESIVIDGEIVITVMEVGRNGQVRLGIDAPRHHQVYRRELLLEIQSENRSAATIDPAAAAAMLGSLLPASPTADGKPRKMMKPREPRGPEP